MCLKRVGGGRIEGEKARPAGKEREKEATGGLGVTTPPPPHSCIREGTSAANRRKREGGGVSRLRLVEAGHDHGVAAEARAQTACGIKCGGNPIALS
mmetsp:Transcript_21310/g.42341  ORF Transcript_21310/g.42341 Transcript_21310/m.42341 type:complete len:97 (+) Transcript_21310:1133-1423(+)